MRHLSSTSTSRLARVLTAVVLTACADNTDRVTTPTLLEPRTLTRVTAPAPLAMIEEPVMLTTPTYERSGEVVHPDVVEFPRAWAGHKFWLTVTPYAKSASFVENPSILVSDDGRQMNVPTGLANPVVPHAGTPKDYNSDPELVYDASTNKLLLFYRFVDKKTNTIYVTSSRDGLTWQREPKVFWARAHAAVSPTVTAQSATGQPIMWYVDAGKAGCHTKSSRIMMRTATDGKLVGAHWTSGVPTDLAQPGYVIWHMKVRYVPSKGEYWALYAAFPDSPVGCDIDDLFFARSTDGIHWQTFAQPLLHHEDRTWTAAALYRSTFLYDADSDQLRVWFSARGDDAKWHLGFSRFRYESLLGTLSDTTSRSRSPNLNLALGGRFLGHSEEEP